MKGNAMFKSFRCGAIVAVLAAGPALAAEPTGDPAAGARAFAQCRTCHVTTAGVNRIGPSLHSVIGRPVASIAGFNYSSALKKFGGSWTPARLTAYLASPRTTVPGTRMAYAGLKGLQQQADILAYLKTQ